MTNFLSWNSDEKSIQKKTRKKTTKNHIKSHQYSHFNVNKLIWANGFQDFVRIMREQQEASNQVQVGKQARQTKKRHSHLKTGIVINVLSVCCCSLVLCELLPNNTEMISQKQKWSFCSFLWNQRNNDVKMCDRV